MKTRLLFSLVLIGTILSCEKSVEEPFVQNPDLETTEAKAFIANTNEFALDFFRSIAGNEVEENYMVSPVSLSMALGMVHNGAAGETFFGGLGGFWSYLATPTTAFPPTSCRFRL